MKEKHKGLLTRSQYAAHRGIDKAEITRAVQTGKISVKEIDGEIFIDPISADKEYDANSDPRMVHMNKIMKEQAALEKQEDDVTSASPIGRAPNFAKSRALREEFNARLAKLDYEQKLGKVVLIDEVRAEAMNLSRTISSAYLSLPDRVAGKLASMTDMNEIHLYLTKEINKILENLVESNRWK